MFALSGVYEHIVKRIAALILVLIGLFLALDAIRAPRHSHKALRANLLFAMQTGSETTIVNAAQRGAHVTQ